MGIRGSRAMSQNSPTKPKGPRLFHVKGWLNAPRNPPFDRFGIPRGSIKVTRGFYNSKLERVFDFTAPGVFWFTAKQFAGKSTGVEDIEIEYIEHGGTAIDIFSADDEEGAGFCDSGYKVLLLTGDRVDLGFSKTKYDWMHVGDLKMNTPDQIIESLNLLARYQVVVTVPGFFYDANEMFRSLSRLIELLKRRGLVQWTFPDGSTKIFCVAVREAKVLLASRYYSGKINSRQDAEMDLIDLVDKAFHTGIALCFDSLRYMSITPEIRDITHYMFIKRLGRMKLPPEFNFIMRYVNPRYMRRMPKHHYVLYTDEDDVYFGTNDAVPWHVKRGEPVLSRLGIEVTYKEKKVKAPSSGSPAEPGQDTEDQVAESRQTEVGGKKWKVALDIHKRIVDLVTTQGLSYARAQVKLETETGLHLSSTTLFNEMKVHKAKLCLCQNGEEEEPEAP